MVNCGEQELTRQEFRLTCLGTFDSEKNSSSWIFIWTWGKWMKLPTRRKRTLQKVWAQIFMILERCWEMIRRQDGKRIKTKKRSKIGNREGKGINVMQWWRLTEKSRLKESDQLQPILEAGNTRVKGLKRQPVLWLYQTFRCCKMFLISWERHIFRTVQQS